MLAPISPTQDEVPRLDALKGAVDACRACPLWKPATQGVAGEGRKGARIMLVGEQPGDEEDLAGRPFVGPAGRLLDAALEEAGVERDDAYVTNAVKHFKFVRTAKRRLHQKPSAGEVEVCRWWLTEEKRLVAPRLVVALGATAARSVLGRPAPVTKLRGRIIEDDEGGAALVTVHPSFLLRIPDRDERRRQRALFVDDLRLAGDIARRA